MNITLEKHIEIFNEFLSTHRKKDNYGLVRDMMANELLDEIPDLESDMYKLSLDVDLFPNMKDKRILFHVGIEDMSKKYNIHNMTPLMNELYLTMYENRYGI